MAYARTTTVDSGAAGDTVKQAILDCDTDITGIFADLNTHEALTTNAHGFTGTKTGSGAMVGATSPTLTTPTLTGTVTLSSATMSAGTYTSPTLNTPTIVTPTITGVTTLTNASLTGGTLTNATLVTPTLTGTVTATSATITGGTYTSPTINTPTVVTPTLTGVVTASSATITAPTVYNSILTGILTLGTATMTANYKAFANSGGTAPEWAIGYKIGTLTRAMAGNSGDVSYTGCGFKPSYIVFLSQSNSGSISIGFDNITAKYAITVWGTSVPYYSSTAVLSISMIEAADKMQTGVVKTFDTDGFTITWTKTGSPATADGTIFYMAFR